MLLNCNTSLKKIRDWHCYVYSRKLHTVRWIETNLTTVLAYKLCLWWNPCQNWWLFFFFKLKCLVPTAMTFSDFPLSTYHNADFSPQVWWNYPLKCSLDFKMFCHSDNLIAKVDNLIWHCTSHINEINPQRSISRIAPRFFEDQS